MFEEESKRLTQQYKLLQEGGGPSGTGTRKGNSDPAIEDPAQPGESDPVQTGGIKFNGNTQFNGAKTFAPD